MIVSGVLEGGVALLIAIIGAAVLVGQIKENAKRNQEDIEAIKTMMHEYQEDMKHMITKNMSDMKEMINENKAHQSDSLSREVNHLKDLINMSNAETREDIKRLELEQKESNNLKMKVAVLTQSVKSLHRRLDVEIPAVLEDN